jgi:hypothetical protein
LLEALRSVPYDQAIELAHAAEAFVMGSAVEIVTEQGRQSATAAAQHAEIQQLSAEVSSGRRVLANAGARHGSLALADDERDRLLDRLAEGSRNAGLAAEFGISAKQVQGIRMGCAREIAKRRASIGDETDTPPDRDQPSTAAASIEEIVRYLRQQGDIVVPQKDREFLVNSRFRLHFNDLVARANRMRRRQGKPAFELHGGERGNAEPVSSGNGSSVVLGEAMTGRSLPSAQP